MRPVVTRRFCPWLTLPLIGLLLAACPAAVAPSQPQHEPRDVLLMASTIGPIDAGIVGALEDAYLAKTGVLVRHAGAGTGAALDMAKRGGFDLVMVHARALEDKFVADGFGVDRRDIMYNDFVILGPPSDPAGIRGERRAAAALTRIAQRQALFVTRGDNSGTHVKDSDLLNHIAVIRVNPARFPKTNAAGAQAFVDWLVSDEAQLLIKSFGVDRYGESLFFPNSDEWRKKHPN
jgi:ABC-type tungstate transport system permease subunit